MTDYYLGFIGKDRTVEWGKWNSRLKGLAIGESFTVSTESDRKGALKASKRMGVCVRSEKLISGGFNIQRTNVCAPRKRGHPKKHYEQI
jgi:hypothetical protein